ncbi:MAG: hypothetical protein E6Q97_09440 [Desulfurellales bacterium]|nr:MAG: hypothetical protein E6Q97_09440 [Desulfurellales bacterium]
MTRPFDHERDQERESATVDSLIRLPSFLSEAYGEITQAECDEHVRYMADADYIAAGQVYDRVARRVAATQITQLIRLSHPSPVSRSEAAHELLREHERKSYRSAGTAPYGAAIPGSLPAERSLSMPQDHAATPGPADLSSTDRRDAA